MEEQKKPFMEEALRQLSLPSYEQIPNVGLFLEQVSLYINEYLLPLPGFGLTPSMISNYVKKGLIANPVKKQYGREQIAYLFFIAVGKAVLSLEDLQLLIRLQQMTYSPQRAYDYFRLELRNVLEYVFELKPEPEQIGSDQTREKAILRNAIIAVAHKVYLNQMLALAAEAKMEP